MVQINSILGEVCPGVQVLNEQQVGTIFTLRKHGWSVNAISQQFGWTRNTIQGWLDRGLPTRTAEDFQLTRLKHISGQKCDEFSMTENTEIRAFKNSFAPKNPDKSFIVL